VRPLYIGVARRGVVQGTDGGGLSGAHSAVPGNALAAALLATMCWGLAAQNYRRNLSQLDPLCALNNESA
jgi:uncharacterized protein YaaW (UPF0174 family)